MPTRRAHRLPRRSLHAAALVAVAATIALAATGATAAPAGGVARGGVLRLGGWGDIESLDPAVSYTPASWLLLHGTCARLFNYAGRQDAAGAQVVPEVVQRATVSRDGRSYTFDLRRTFRFNTGERVDAASFVRAFERDAKPKLAPYAVQYLREIAGADAVVAGKANSISGVRVLAPYRLQIRLTRPLGDLRARLTMPFFCPLPRDTPTDREVVSGVAGSGPYFVAEFAANRRIVLRRNPYYRGSRPANVDVVDWTFGLDEEECLAATERNEIDLCPVYGVRADAHRNLAAKYGINRSRYFVGALLSSWYFAFNHDRPAFDGVGQIPLAKAINYALDRPALARAFGYLSGRRSDRILPPALGRAEHVYPIAGADAKTAQQWLARAKRKPKQLVLYTLNRDAGVGAAQVFVYDLRQLGIDVQVKYFDSSVLFEKVGTRGEPYDVVLAGWATDYADPAAFFRPLLDGRRLAATGNVNFSYLDDPRVSAAIDAADRLTGNARRQAFADLDAELMREAPPWAPFLHTNARDFVSASVGCFFVHPVYGLDIAAVCKK